MDLNSEEYPRFRILIIGKPGTGKSTLISSIFGASLADVQRDRADTADINEGITSPHNRYLILHGFQHYDPENVEKFDILKKFIEERSKKESRSERLHAIWLCITVPHDDGEIVKADDDSIFKLNRNKVPIIVVFTKFDLLMASLDKAGTEQGKVQKLAEKKINERYGKIFENAIKNNLNQTQYALVSVSLPETLCRLVNITIQSVDTNISSPRTCIARLKSHVSNNYKTSEKNLRTKSHSDSRDLAQIFLAAAHGVNIPIKITASIKAVKEKYWRATGSGVSLQKCVSKIHRRIVTIWDIRNLNEFLLDDTFYRQMITIVDDLYHPNTGTMHRDVTKASRAAGEWTTDVYQGRPEHIRCLMGFVVDIILILQAASSFEDKRKVTPEDVNGIIYEFICSERKEVVHKAIIAFVGDHDLPRSDMMADKIESLIKETEAKKTDAQFDETRLLPSLLTILRFETSPQNAINRFTLDLMGKLLDSPDYLASISALGATSDIELLLDFIICLLRNSSLKNCGIQDPNRKARRVVDKLSKNDVLPKTLFISDVKTDLCSIGAGGFGSVYKGEHHGRSVALKALHKVHKKGDSHLKDFCREALAWWSLSHQFILPLLGIYEENSQLFLISPYMMNGTLIEWRKTHWPGEAYIRTMMLEVARGLEYIHSEGIVHGDLSAANVLLDSEFRCHITDFGLTRHIESTLSPSAMAISINYAAPELVGICATCRHLECDGCPGQGKGKTTQTDVYAYGCLYYAVFFDTVPFQEKEQCRIIFLLANGDQPDRLPDPKMDDDTWNLVEQCWFRDPSKRPTMKQIVDSHHDSPLTALISELKGLGGSMVNQYTLRLMRQLLDLSESDIISELTNVSDVELLLDFILHLLRNQSLPKSGSRDANWKARRLMFKLLSANVVPKSLFINDVRILIDMSPTKHDCYMGEYKGQSVVLKVVDEGRNNDSPREAFCRQALSWRSLVHRSILPLLGVFEDRSQLCLVSPFMMNGSLSEWRKDHSLLRMAELHTLMLEVAQGVHYIHSEGMVHGNLHGRNILVDSDLRCQIAGFGSIRHSEATGTQTTTTHSLNLAAPELVTECMCGQVNCSRCYEGYEKYLSGKTMESDVYAFGCLYYVVFFDTVPLHGINTNYQIVQFLKDGRRPDRLERPKMDDKIWKLIQKCWEPIPSNRPTMKEIVEVLTPLHDRMWNSMIIM